MILFMWSVVHFRKHCNRSFDWIKIAMELAVLFSDTHSYSIEGIGQSHDQNDFI